MNADMKMPQKKSSPARKRKPGLAGRLDPPSASIQETKVALRLYVSGSTSKSVLAVKNIKRICEEHLKNRYDLEVIDIYQQPNLARDEQIVALPTLIKRSPLPLRRLIGDLSNQKKVLIGLDLEAPEE
jgi:circadian clock protein KaiB